MTSAKQRNEMFDTTSSKKRVWEDWHYLRQIPFLSKWEGSRHARVLGLGISNSAQFPNMFSVVHIQEYTPKTEDVVVHSIMCVQPGDTVPDETGSRFLGVVTKTEDEGRWLVFYMGFEEGSL